MEVFILIYTGEGDWKVTRLAGETRVGGKAWEEKKYEALKRASEWGNKP